MHHASPALHVTTPHDARHLFQATSASATVIDGSQTPNLIPDSAAQRLYLLSLTHMDPDVRHAQLMYAGVRPGEMAAADALVTDFKANWDTLRTARNQAVAAAIDGGDSTRIDFLSRRDALVSNFMNSLQGAISPASMSVFNSHLQSEKRHMKVSVAQ